ncbi:protein DETOXIFICATION 46, chloroplastic [Trifolium repens]|nr:protein DETOXIFICATION 46, chloroplastic [Trifolium repens]
MKDSWGPLKALAAASIINGIGDIILCSYLGYGIAGAAWATLVSQVVAAYMMSQTLNEKGYNAFSFSIHSGKEFLAIFSLSAPVFLSLLLKMGFYALLVYFATSMGTHTTAAHQARSLLRSLLTIGAILGLLFGIVGTFVPLLFPYMFTPDHMVIQDMHKILIPYFLALMVTPATIGLEGTLLVLRYLVALHHVKDRSCVVDMVCKAVGFTLMPDLV